MAKRKKYHQGIFTPQNPAKYSGKLHTIEFRSSWELRVMKWFDLNSSIVKWNSEGIVIPYLCPTDGEWHRYFVDFACMVEKKDGTHDYFLVEIKPASQRVPPKYRGRITKTYLEESATYAKNQAKWKAAAEFCKQKGWQFIILDEYDLGLKKKPDVKAK
jgi:hypothetical protein